MKNHRFALGIFCGVLLSSAVFVIVSFKSESKVTLSQEPTKVTSFDNYSTTDVYKLFIDNTEFIVVNNGKGGVAIIKHN
jgi:hypothetical protein